MKSNKIPVAIDSEIRVLSACLSGEYSSIATIIKSYEDFYKEEHRVLFEAIQKVVNSGKEVTKLQIARALGSDKLNQIGGATFISDIVSVPYSQKDVINDAMYILEKSIARQSINKYNDILKELYSDSDVFSSLDQMANFHNEINNKLSSLSVFSFDKEKDRTLEEIQLRHEGKSDSELFVKINKIDNVIGGFQKKTLNILGARPGGGKTAMAIQFLNNLSIKQDKKCIFFSLEMSNSAIIERLLSNYCSENKEVVSNFEIKKGFLGNEKRYNNFLDATKTYNTENIFIYENIYSIQDIRNKSIQMVKNHGIECIFIDHFHIIQSTSSFGNDTSKYTEISGMLKMLAKECDVPIICLAQLSRGTESRDSKMPILSDLRGSGSIEQDADTVTFFYRPNYYDANADTNDCQVSISKNRNGACENFSLWVDIKNSTFLDDVRPTSYNNNYEQINIPINNNEFFKSLDLDIPF
jgi:replicative DNA helicase